MVGEPLTNRTLSCEGGVFEQAKPWYPSSVAARGMKGQTRLVDAAHAGRVAVSRDQRRPDLAFRARCRGGGGGRVDQNPGAPVGPDRHAAAPSPRSQDRRQVPVVVGVRGDLVGNGAAELRAMVAGYAAPDGPGLGMP